MGASMSHNPTGLYGLLQGQIYLLQGSAWYLEDAGVLAVSISSTAYLSMALNV
jgi:hypothetical protein